MIILFFDKITFTMKVFLFNFRQEDIAEMYFYTIKTKLNKLKR